jgi:hypothetical protein
VGVQAACEDLGVELPHYSDGQHQGLICPFCGGGSQKELSFSVKVETVEGQGIHALYKCFRSNNCGAEGRIPSTQVRGCHFLFATTCSCCDAKSICHTAMLTIRSAS